MTLLLAKNQLPPAMPRVTLGRQSAEQTTISLGAVMKITSKEDALADRSVTEAIRRKILRIAEDRITYALNHEKSYNWNDHEEWVRACTVAWLIRPYRN